MTRDRPPEGPQPPGESTTWHRCTYLARHDPGNHAGVMTLHTAWEFSQVRQRTSWARRLIRRPNMAFVLAAARNLPSQLEKSDRYYLKRPPECHCQQLLSYRSIEAGRQCVECSRLHDALEGKKGNDGLLFHASVDPS